MARLPPQERVLERRPWRTEPSHYSNEPELIRPVETQPALAQPWHRPGMFTWLLHSGAGPCQAVSESGRNSCDAGCS